jgi:hypothetical protein
MAHVFSHMLHVYHAANSLIFNPPVKTGGGGGCFPRPAITIPKKQHTAGEPHFG